MSSDLDTRKKRALWRANHRGTKEMDWLLGKFAEAKLPAMGEAELGQFERFMALPDPELQAWLMAAAGPHGLEFSDLIGEVRAHHGLAGESAPAPSHQASREGS